MSKMIVTNPNILFDSSTREGGDIQADRRLDRPHCDAEISLIREVRRLRQEIEELACSATWAEDCLFRGADYAPDFRCDCPVCREFFPNRRHPRGVRESRYSLDCQIETDEDPEFAEEFARLRNDRRRIGSVFIRHPRISMDKNQIGAGR